MNNYDVTVIGGGPAGLAAAISASKKNAHVLLLERESKLGGVLKQCIHDGFGVIKFGEKLSGCEYATRFVHEIKNTDVEISLLTFASNIQKAENGYIITLVTCNGVENVFTKTLVLATGCRERTAKQVSIHGSRPAGVFTAGSAQYFINVLGQMPGKKCVILGSGDIGLIMARRLTLEGATVLGVYEAKAEPSGLMRNIYQCLIDFDIPLHLSETVTEVHGRNRVTGVTIAKVDSNMEPIPGTEELIECDTLILSVGLIPENELAETIGVTINSATKGPLCNQRYMTEIPGVFSCGNALHVNDLVDYVSESGEKAGEAAALFDYNESNNIAVKSTRDYLYVVPQLLDLNSLEDEVTFFFRTYSQRDKTKISLLLDGKPIFTKIYESLRPPEMEKIIVPLSNSILEENSNLEFAMEVI